MNFYPFPKLPFSLLFIGKRKSGKTTLLCNILNDECIYANKFDKIYVFSINFEYDKTWALIADKVTEYRDFWDEEFAEEIFNMNDNSEEPENILVIFDDMGNEGVVKKGNHNNIYDKMQATGRHRNISICSLFQQFTTASRPAIVNADAAIVFYQRTTKDKKIFYEDFGVGEAKECIKILDYFTKEPYSFLIANSSSGQTTYFDKNYKLI